MVGHTAVLVSPYLEIVLRNPIDSAALAATMYAIFKMPGNAKNKGQRRRANNSQLEIRYRTWGGRRDGAGRKRSPHSGVPHLRRPRLAARWPVHISLKLTRDLPYLRKRRLGRLVRDCILRANKAGVFRIVHFALLAHHLHLIVEAKNREALSRGMQGAGDPPGPPVEQGGRPQGPGRRGPLPRAHPQDPPGGPQRPLLRAAQLGPARAGVGHRRGCARRGSVFVRGLLRRVAQRQRPTHRLGAAAGVSSTHMASQGGLETLRPHRH